MFLNLSSSPFVLFISFLIQKTYSWSNLWNLPVLTSMTLNYLWGHIISSCSQKHTLIYTSESFYDLLWSRWCFKLTSRWFVLNENKETLYELFILQTRKQGTQFNNKNKCHNREPARIKCFIFVALLWFECLIYHSCCSDSVRVLWS